MKTLRNDFLERTRENRIPGDGTEHSAALLPGIPAEEGFIMPGEFEPHAGCILIWPERPGSWTYGARAAREAFCKVIAVIAESETVYVAAGADSIDSATEMLFNSHVKSGSVQGSRRFDENVLQNTVTDAWRRHVEVFPAETDDAWARDIAPTFLVCHREGAPDKVRAVNWAFNAWGGLVDGLYANWEKDDAFAKLFCHTYGYGVYDAKPFVLEGGAIHSDGEGTLLVTEACLLSAGRNPVLTKEQIESRLKVYLGVQKVLWLPRGIYRDETNEHVDNICAFLRPGEVVLAWTDDEKNPQYLLSQECLTYLTSVTDARGRKLTVHKLPIPNIPIIITEKDLCGYRFEAGEEQRRLGELLAASYVNFYFSNDAIVLPVFGGENEESDRRAVSLMQRWNTKRKVIPIYARDILTGGGNIHCVTQQIPAASKTEGRDYEEQYKGGGDSA